jgi:quercetin dioxygenase-like cupin family protein
MSAKSPSAGPLVRLPGEGWAGATAAGLPLIVRMRGAETGGTVSVVEIEEQPRSTARIHRHEYDEAWYVIHGEYALCVERDWYWAPPGTLIYVPGGSSHGFAVLGEESARKLSIALPGGSEDQYLTDVADRLAAVVPEFVGVVSVPAHLLATGPDSR